MAEHIERESAIDALQNHYEVRNAVQNGIMDECVMLMMRVPAADVVPVRHGRWEKATGMMPPEYCGLHICSECGHYAGRKPPYGGKEMLSDYCPNCGALMDKDGDGDV